MKRLYALRGAVCCENTEEDMRLRIAGMYDELVGLNNLEEEEIVSAIFSATVDLTAANPCTALREAVCGKTNRAATVPLFSAQEPQSDNSLEKTVRVIIHCYLEEGVKTHHVYRNGAQVLRKDRVL